MMEQRSGILQISLYFVAITACFCIYSLIQERIMTVGFGPEKEVFRYSAFIVFINRIVTCIVSASVLYITKQPLAPMAPVLLFAIPSVANVISSTAQYEALKYVNFPLQALAKCAKSVRHLNQRPLTITFHYFGALTPTLLRLHPLYRSQSWYGAGSPKPEHTNHQTTSQQSSSPQAVLCSF